MSTCARCGREGTKGFKQQGHGSAAYVQPVCNAENACADRCTDMAIPENALRLPGFVTIAHLHEGDTDLDLGTVVFADGGSLVWYEAPDVVVVWHVTTARGRDRWPTRYRGTRNPCDCPTGGRERQPAAAGKAD